MQKRGIFRLLAASAAIILIVSVCCITVLGYDMDNTPRIYTGTVTKDENQSAVEPTEAPSSTENSSIETSSSEPSHSSTSPATSSHSSSSNEPSDGSSSTPSHTSSSETNNGSQNESGDNQGATTGGQQGGGTNNQGDNTYQSQGTYNPDTTTNSSSTTTVISGPDFSDEDNSELINDGSVISGLPIGGESESSASTEESSSQVESTASSSGNSGSTFLLVLGIVLIVVGVAGLGAVVYLQFIRPKQKPKKTDSLYGGNFDVYHDGYDMSSSPLQKDVDTKADTAEIDIHSHSSDDKK